MSSIHRNAIIVLVLVTLNLFNAPFAGAQDSSAATADAATRIEVDEEADVIRFIVGGEERAVLDADGLHVNGSVEFTGTMTDIQVWPESEVSDAP
ncbi:MAG: hypothetical protein CMM50_06880 [Rhodospirillaceae bacterium]|nr:hypothetical protein [Rhodospirillaceae bacterium]